MDLFGAQHPLPTLSLWEPWASLIAAGFKRHETRHWPTRVRGTVAIHAAKRLDVAAAPDKLCRFAFGPDWTRTRPAGAVVAVVNLTACVHTREAAAYALSSDLESGNYGPFRFAFRLDDVRPLIEPIPLTGRQGFFSWTPPPDLAQRRGPPVDHVQQASAYDAFVCGGEA